MTSVSIIRKQADSIEIFTKKILSILHNLPAETSLVVFPEYCWGRSTIIEVNNSIDQIRSQLDFNVVFGTHAFDTGNGKITNNAIIALKNKNTIYSAKTVPMIGEQNKQNVQAGKNIGVILIDDIKIGVLICADLWNWRLVHELITKQGAQILVIPAFTVVPVGLHKYAKYQWLSLAITRSREFVIPILISDHNMGTDEYDVGQVTCIIDPSIKDPNIKSIEDFVYMSHNDSISLKINFNPIFEYRNYRNANGLLQK